MKRTYMDIFVDHRTDDAIHESLYPVVSETISNIFKTEVSGYHLTRLH